MKKNRRQFLRNASLAVVSATLIPKILKSKEIIDVMSPASKEACEETTEDFYGEGPFYTENAPSISNNKLIDDTEPGTKLIISGRVQTPSCDKVIPNTLIDVWHADDAGNYDNSGCT